MQKLKWGVVLFVALVGLGALAVAIGWGAHALVERAAPMATTPAASSVTETPRPTPTLLLVAETPHLSVPAPTSTLAPTATQDIETVLTTDRGLYDVCRRHCPDRWPVSRVPRELDRYARAVAEHNGLTWPGRSAGPVLQPGDELEMLPCPPN